MQPIETERLILRRLTPDDLDDLAALQSDPDVMRFWPRSYTREESGETIAWAMRQYEEHGYGLYATIYKGDGRFIGRCGLLRQVVDDVAEVEVGYMLAKAFWGRGLAPEAARACMDWAFRELGVPRVISLIRPENHPSIRVAEKNGLRLEREIERWGGPHRVYVFDRSTWLERQP